MALHQLTVEKGHDRQAAAEHERAALANSQNTFPSVGR